MKRLKRLLLPLWFSFLILPFTGAKGFLLTFAAFFLLSAGGSALKRLGPIRLPWPSSRLILPPALLFVLALPIFAGDYAVDVAILAGIYIILASGLNVVVGFTGLLCLGFAAFYAIGAYSYALLTTKMGLGFWGALPLSAALSTLSGLLLAVPALRLRGDYLAIVTLGFGEIVRLVLNNWDGLTNGPNGISGIPRPSLMGLPLDGLNHYYYFVLAAVVFSVAVIRNVCSSKTGRAWTAIREDETAAGAAGINTVSYRFYSFAFGAFWAGIGGVLFASKMRFVSPESFTFMESVLMLCMVILGGLGSIYGPVLGAVLLVALPEMLRDFQLYRMLILGAGLVLLMVFRPQGLLGTGNDAS